MRVTVVWRNIIAGLFAPAGIKMLPERNESMPGWKNACWKCMLCHYIYDPDKGDAEHGVKAGVSFQDLPPHWECPKCGSRRNLFRPVIEENSQKA
jgi:rubredoxin